MKDKLEKKSEILSLKPIKNENGVFYFCNKKKLEKTAGNSLIGKLQNLLKKRGFLYTKLVSVFSPELKSRTFNKIKKKLLNEYGEDSIILNLGSGPVIDKKRPDIINCDIYPFPGVDIVCDCNTLPFKDNSVDLIINIAMLEHVNLPEKVVSEMYRILKKSGTGFTYIPFIVPFHAAPDDFYRWTKAGAKKLFSQFKEIGVGIASGPTSSLLWVFQEWLSMVLSFGNSALKDSIFIFLMITMFPIKYLDIIFENYSLADRLAFGFYVCSKKHIIEESHGK